MKPLRVVILIVVVGIVAAAGWLSGAFGGAWDSVKTLIVQCLEFIRGLHPVWGVLSFIALYVVATLLFVPGLLVTMAAGLLFGVVKGTVIVSFASVAGSSCAFLIGRFVARDWIAKRLEGRPRFRAIDEAVGRDGARIVLLLRLSPVFPYNFLNYGLGLTGIGFGRYVLASWIGMLPGTIMYVYLGSLARSVAALATDAGAEKSTGQWVLFGAGLLATVVVTIYVTRLARRALESRLPSDTHATA